MPVRPSRIRRLRVRKAMGNVALAGTVLAVAGAYLAIQKSVTLVVEGRPEAVRTMSASVGALLDTQGLELDSGDLVMPAEHTALVDGMTVTVDLGFVEAFMSRTTQGVGVWVMEGVRAPQVLHAAPGTEDPFSASGSVGQPAAMAAHVVVMGKDHAVWTNATTVGELLSAMGIEPDRSDRVLPSPSAPLKPEVRIRFVAFDYRIRALRVPIPFTTVTGYSDDLRPGQARIVRQGVPGLMVERYRIRVRNGEVVGRELLRRTVVREAVPARRLVGRERQGQGTQVGEASWYSFAPGDGLTAAHPSLPFGTVVTVTNLGNGKSVRVVINDRGPFGGRIIDLSHQAFARIAPLGQGVCQVRLTW